LRTRKPRSTGNTGESPGDVADALRQDSKEERQRRPNGLFLLILMSSRVRSYLEKG
jgi:hypothetical protein